MPHAGDLLRLVRVEGCNLATEHGTTDDARDEHVWTLHVDTKYRPAIDLFRNVQARHRLAEQAKVFRIFQRHVFRYRQRGRLVDKRAITRPAPGCFVNDFAFFRGAGVFGYAPVFGCGGDEHRSRRAAGFTQQLPHTADAVAARGELSAAEVRIAVLRVGRRPLGFDLVPVDVQLFSHEHRHGRHHALSHFELRQRDRDGVVGADFEPHVWFKGARRLGCIVQAGNISANNQSATGRAYF